MYELCTNSGPSGRTAPDCVPDATLDRVSDRIKGREFASIEDVRISMPARTFFAVVLAMGLSGVAVAQADPNLPPPPVVSGEANHWGFDTLTRDVATQSSFTFDRSMLSVADSFFANSDAETKRVLAGLNSITVHNYHYRDDVIWDEGAFGMVQRGFDNSGWKHLVNANSKNGGSRTDMWMYFEGANIRHVVVLTRGARNMNYISVDCTLRPLDLLHLSGHFGIPKVDEGAVMVPAPAAPPR